MVAVQQENQTSSLIEFPGVARNAVPQWRKDLSERVREVQEKRAREAELEREALLETAELERQRTGEPVFSTPQLELLPQAEVAPLNPLVAAALRRIERANQGGGRSANANAALAYTADRDYQKNAHAAVDLARAATASASNSQLRESPASDQKSTQADKISNLVMVPRTERAESGDVKTKPRRMITEDVNHPALNYLDSVPTVPCVEDVRRHRAPASSRILCAGVDLIVIGILCAPFAAVTELADKNWQDLFVVMMAVGILSLVAFLYLTILTALTGRTLGMRLFSLRVVDARTGLIPTGSQSAGRALIFVISLLTLGIATLFALIGSDKRTAHDRLTRTAVILA